MDSKLRGIGLFLKLDRTEIAEIRMTALPIIKPFDIFKYILFGFVTGFVLAVMNKLYLEGVEKTLSHRIISTVGFSAHTASDSMSFQQSLKVLTGILNSPVGMMNQSRFHAAVLYRHSQSSHD